MTENPLLRVQFRVPFDQIRPEHVEPAIDQLLAEARRDLEAIVAAPGPRTYANTLDALERMTERLEFAVTVVGHLESVATDPALRAAHNAVQGPVAEFYAQIPLHEGLWRAVQAFAATDEAAALTGERRRLLDKTLDEFRRHGAELDPAGKARLAEISARLAQATTTYAEHVLDATNAYELVLTDPADLAGLPPSAVDAARASAEAKGLQNAWRFTLQQPSFVPFLTYADSPRLREQVYRASNICGSGGPHDNRDLLREILALRREQAELLGFVDFSDFVLKPRMARTGAAARDFVDRLTARSEAAFRAEAAALHEFRKQLEGPGAPEPAPWDLAYYSEKLRKALYDFDDEALRPYFAAPSVLAGLFELVRDLYGVTVEPVTDMPTWHPDVRTYAVRDGDALLGVFYADLYPRETKRGGAWMNAFITGRPDGKGGHEPHLGLICGNLTPPIGDRPALLTHDEVETIFHEFGHLLHHLLTRVETRSLAGTNVAWDFVELPSQIMENWCWEKPALDRFARHVDTGAPIPDDLAGRMLKARTFRAATAMMRQLSFATVDLELHRSPVPASADAIVARARDVMARFSPCPLPADYAMICRFGHLFSSPVAYAAGYYSYKWAEVLDADAFTRFQREGLFSREVGLAFRRAILERGDSEDPAELFRAFMGRDPDPEALLRRAGLAA